MKDSIERTKGDEAKTSTAPACPVERMVMLFYYIVFEKHMSQEQMTKSWVIRKTDNDLDTVDGLQDEIKRIEAEAGCPVWVLNWKRLIA